jgi:hypothetical protein
MEQKTGEAAESDCRRIENAPRNGDVLKEKIHFGTTSCMVKEYIRRPSSSGAVSIADAR